MPIAQGAQPEELFMLSLQKMEQQTVFIPESDAEEVQTDLVIVGGGPAGLTAGIYAARSGIKAVIVERGALGGQVATTPVVENYPGLNQVGGKTLVDIMVNHALEYVKIFPGEAVMEIRPGDPMEVTTSRRRFITKVVLLATGANHRHLGVPGESRLSGRGVSYCSTCDGPLFKGRKVIIVGGGNSAVTEALNLHHIGVDVTLVHRRNTLRAQEHLAKNVFANDIPVLFDTEVKEIRGEARVQEVVLYNNLTEETSTMAVDGVFVAVGYDPAVELAKKVGIELTPEGFIKRDERHRTNVPGIYTAGDVEGGYKQIVTAAGQGSEAAICIFEDLMNPYWTRQARSGRVDQASTDHTIPFHILDFLGRVSQFLEDFHRVLAEGRRKRSGPRCVFTEVDGVAGDPELPQDRVFKVHHVSVDQGLRVVFDLAHLLHRAEHEPSSHEDLHPFLAGLPANISSRIEISASRLAARLFSSAKRGSESNRVCPVASQNVFQYFSSGWWVQMIHRPPLQRYLLRRGEC
jgi:thioredoxin-disulfide reductase